jgi:hypothetical protein
MVGLGTTPLGWRLVHSKGGCKLLIVAILRVLRGGQRVSGNGTRFVWYGGGTQKKHVIKRALIVEVKPGLVPVQEAEGWFGGEAGEGGGHAVDGIAGWLGGGFGFEHAGFQGPGAAETPVCAYHFLDQAELDAIGRLEALEVVIEDFLETLQRFIVHDELASEQAVAERILR